MNKVQQSRELCDLVSMQMRNYSLFSLTVVAHFLWRMMLFRLFAVILLHGLRIVHLKRKTVQVLEDFSNCKPLKKLKNSKIYRDQHIDTKLVSFSYIDMINALFCLIFVYWAQKGLKSSSSILFWQFWFELSTHISMTLIIYRRWTCFSCL